MPVQVQKRSSTDDKSVPLLAHSKERNKQNKQRARDFTNDRLGITNRTTTMDQPKNQEPPEGKFRRPCPKCGKGMLDVCYVIRPGDGAHIQTLGCDECGYAEPLPEPPTTIEPDPANLSRTVGNTRHGIDLPSGHVSHRHGANGGI